MIKVTVEIYLQLSDITEAGICLDRLKNINAYGPVQIQIPHMYELKIVRMKLIEDDYQSKGGIK